VDGALNGNLANTSLFSCLGSPINTTAVRGNFKNKNESLQVTLPKFVASDA
jgi:hypothetical protein